MPKYGVVSNLPIGFTDKWTILFKKKKKRFF